MISVCWANSQKKGTSPFDLRMVNFWRTWREYEAAHLFYRFNFPGDTAVWGIINVFDYTRDLEAYSPDERFLLKNYTKTARRLNI